MCSNKADVMCVDSAGISAHYEIRKRIGKGAYGIVWKATSKKSNRTVAIKKIFDAFRNKEDAQRTYREVSYLREMRGHPNIVQLVNIHRSGNNRDLYLVLEYMEADLHHYLSSGYRLRDPQVRYILYQLLKALKYIHSGNLVHRDVKPSNILLNRQCVSKLADFGLARSLTDPHQPSSRPLTDYVATRWYRAPEILLGASRYTKVVDQWSLGCVLCEMVTGQPLLRGSSTADQLQRISALIPSQGPDMDTALRYLGCPDMGPVRPPPEDHPRGLEEALSAAPSDCLDLAARLLSFNPLRRISAVQALSHPYLARYKEPRTELFLLRPVVPKLPEDSRLSVEDYRSALYRLEDRLASKSLLPIQLKPKPTGPLRPLMRPHLSKTDSETSNSNGGYASKAGPSRFLHSSSDLTLNKGKPLTKFSYRTH